MDRQSEKAFVNRLNEIVKDETLILITHKTSILSLVDRIIIVDDGKIIADGPKDKILSNGNKV
jgi:ATP-binding cassette subfamily C protein LapB